jgi:hypothetical protein
MSSDIHAALAAIRSSPALDDLAIYKMRVAEGLERQLASRLVIFLPMVYCRLLLADSGARFSDEYRIALADGTTSAVQRLADEPLWNDSMEFAKAEIEGGLSGHDLLAIASHSAEFHALNQLIAHGSKLGNIAFDAPTIRWPEL